MGVFTTATGQIFMSLDTGQQQFGALRSQRVALGLGNNHDQPLRPLRQLQWVLNTMTLVRGWRDQTEFGQLR